MVDEYSGGNGVLNSPKPEEESVGLADGSIAIHRANAGKRAAGIKPANSSRRPTNPRWERLVVPYTVSIIQW